MKLLASALLALVFVPVESALGQESALDRRALESMPSGPEKTAAAQDSESQDILRGFKSYYITSSAGAAPQQTGAGEKNQPVALPAAREELLGELSDEPKDVAEVVLSNDGMRFAAKIKRGKQWVLVVDGKEGPVSEDFAGISFSRSGARHIIYAVKRSGKWTEMMDGKELGAQFDAPVPDPSRNPHLSAGPLWTPAPYTPGSIGGILNGLDAVGMFSTMISTRFGQNVAPSRFYRVIQPLR